MNLNLMDSSLQPLAFHHPSLSSLTPLTHLWTCLALLTAAFSFWKIRSSSATTPPSPKSQSPPPPPSSSLNPDVDVVRQPRPLVDDVNGVTRGKFTAYYISEDIDRDSHRQCETTEECHSEREERSSSSSSSSTSISEWWESWEKLLKMRMGESKSSGWYVHQDLTELNGNVVRLWDAHAHAISTSSILH